MNVENSQPIGISPTTKQNAASKNESYAQHFRAKYPLLPPCNSKCSLSCTEKVDNDFRHGIWYKFRSFRFKERRQWLDAHVTVLNVKKRKRNTLKARLRKYSLLYTLPKPDGTEVRVCKKMFLATLGARTDGIVMKFVQAKVGSAEGSIVPNTERRGRRKNPRNATHEAIIAHIESYNPVVSHYMREHAPNRRYLEPHLTIQGNSNCKNLEYFTIYIV